MILIIFSIGSAGVAGCGEPTDEPEPSGDAVVEIGTGDETNVEFVPLVEEQELALFEGPQRGHHFILHVRMRGLAPGDPSTSQGEDNPYTSFNVLDEAGTVVDLGSSVYRLGFRDVEDGWYRLPSARLVMVKESLVDSLIDSRLRLRVQVRDAEDRMAVDDVWITAYEIPWPED